MQRQTRKPLHSLNLAGFVSAIALMAAAACSSDKPQGSSVLGSQCDANDPSCGSVGDTCSADAQCSTGHCSAGSCEAKPECAGEPDCVTLGAGGSFNDTIFVDDLEPSQGGSEDEGCVELEVEFERVTPTVVLLIDQSGSMTQNFDGGKDRWETLRDTLTDPDSSLLNALDASVRFGMVLYTSNGGFGDDDKPRTCPVLKKVGIALDNFSAMSDMLSDNGPAGDTPTAESMEAVSAELLAFAEEGPKSIILATDGDPDTCEDPDANDDDGSKDRSVAAVHAAFERGIATRVISVGDEVAASHLKDLAVAGTGGDQSAEAYTALETSQLVDAFNEIIGSVRTCDFTLAGTVEPRDASRGTVAVDGRALAFEDPNGWEMPSNNTVRLLGQACEQVQADAAGISMSFPCDAIRIIPR
jgi:hypothetical protein